MFRKGETILGNVFYGEDLRSFAPIFGHFHCFLVVAGNFFRGFPSKPALWTLISYCLLVFCFCFCFWSCHSSLPASMNLTLWTFLAIQHWGHTWLLGGMGFAQCPFYVAISDLSQVGAFSASFPKSPASLW